MDGFESGIATEIEAAKWKMKYSLFNFKFGLS
jgi:hypothetical protein